MSMKTVYCSIPPRKKVVKFLSEPYQSDLALIKEKLLEAAKNDEILRSTFENHFIVLQMIDSYINEWVDIEETDEVPDRADIKVVLMPGLNSIQDLKIGQSVSLNLDVISLPQPLDKQKSTSSDSVHVDIQNEDSQVLDKEVLEKLPVTDNKKVC